MSNLEKSAKKIKGEIAQVELAAATEKGKLCFSELEMIAILRVHRIDVS